MAEDSALKIQRLLGSIERVKSSSKSDENDDNKCKIRVHVANFHGPFSHIHIALEQLAEGDEAGDNLNRSYLINRWGGARAQWDWFNCTDYYLKGAGSTYSFDITADPNKIVQNWQDYHKSQQETATVVGNNCAVAAQWFLREFAGVPDPFLDNFSANHLAFGILWPSFIPCPITLPGRIMSNVKAHIDNDSMSEAESEAYNTTFVAMALATLQWVILSPVVVPVLLILMLADACLSLYVKVSHLFAVEITPQKAKSIILTEHMVTFLMNGFDRNITWKPTQDMINQSFYYGYCQLIKEHPNLYISDMTFESEDINQLIESCQVKISEDVDLSSVVLALNVYSNLLLAGPSESENNSCHFSP